MTLPEIAERASKHISDGGIVCLRAYTCREADRWRKAVEREAGQRFGLGVLRIACVRDNHSQDEFLLRSYGDRLLLIDVE